ncbi:DUF4214 domain-containing protein [Chelatococcus asaccharovorans]|uniref:DUF4214 domain-containing protein n=1 Tax=Chelatococcus asaccharovorans TaxID=28210 RepID=UPI00224C68F1|nr:DUF4214 domain-containing protein [Chelatococcus asaccharovorans]CAH1650605.1 conserved hypothetical protein [Chelatococcus asaccharovorans]CAH1692398.1 conserved hypothetical protein [Chelatococcus asaccharovorans]
MTTALAGSTFLDFIGDNTGATGTPESAFGLTSTTALAGDTTITLALVLNRANDASGLLGADWGTRQTAILQGLADGTLFKTYGASDETWAAVTAVLAGAGITPMENSADYVTGQESRTVWLTLTVDQFNALFNVTLMLANAGKYEGLVYWDGELSVADELAGSIAGLYLAPITSNADATLGATPPVVPVNTTAETPAQGPQSPGNASSAHNDYTPNVIAAGYGAPSQSGILPPGTATGTIGLIEPGIGGAMPAGASDLPTALASYLASIGVDATPTVYYADQGTYGTGHGERDLDIGIVSAVTPTSAVALYAQNAVFQAWLSAVWDDTASPEAISASYELGTPPVAGSIFANAYTSLFEDLALHGISGFQSSGDRGTNAHTGNGIANIKNVSVSPYLTVVGGTSSSDANSAPHDTTLDNYVQSLGNGDLTTLVTAIRSGYQGLSSSTWLETVWNEATLTGTTMTSYVTNGISTGGVDTGQAMPGYQTDAGLGGVIVTADGVSGRGSPDVSANAGGNLFYTVPTGDYSTTIGNGGTSASTPLWAAFTAQLNGVFAALDLPRLGYYNDLLYTASLISPAAFNDVVLGNNASSFVEDRNGPLEFSEESASGPQQYVDGYATGVGYSAGDGYDLTTGLGTPNGPILTQALAMIATNQLASKSLPEVFVADGGDWSAGSTGRLILQAQTSSVLSIDVGGTVTATSGEAQAAFAWDSYLAQAFLKPAFDSDIIIGFDGQSQGSSIGVSVAAGAAVDVMEGGTSLDTAGATLTSPYGFVNYGGTGEDTEAVLARPVAIAQSSVDDGQALVRLRQVTQDDVSISFYRVDDLDGSINGIAVGAAGYAEAVASRLYATTTGLTSIDGPGYGGYAEALITGVGSGDIVAAVLTTDGNAFYAFDQANESVNGNSVNHLWNYGANTWGFEATYGGGDRDFNDLVYQIDFVQAKGTGVLTTGDVTGVAGELYGLYQLAVDRQPDSAGMGYWMAVEEATSLLGVAENMMGTSEFQANYTPGESNTDFVTRLYDYGLNRAPDQAGLDYWVNALDNGMSQAQLLVEFASSAERFALQAPYTQYGIAYQPFDLA